MATVLGEPKPWPEETHDGQVPGSYVVQVGVIVRRGKHHAQRQQDEEPNDRAPAMRPEIGRGDCTDWLDVEGATFALLALLLRLRHCVVSSSIGWPRSDLPAKPSPIHQTRRCTSPYDQGPSLDSRRLAAGPDYYPSNSRKRGFPNPTRAAKDDGWLRRVAIRPDEA